MDHNGTRLRLDHHCRDVLLSLASQEDDIDIVYEQPAFSAHQNHRRDRLGCHLHSDRDFSPVPRIAENRSLRRPLADVEQDVLQLPACSKLNSSILPKVY